MKAGGAASSRREKEIVRALCAWFVANRRLLPWRPGQDEAPDGPRDPYLVLVSEAMLQQTQVSRVIGKFEQFIRRFPTIKALAGADEADVLAAWSGLGYYRRARSLHAAARMVVERFGGAVPSDDAALRELPGVGAYTAGAVASLAFGARAALVDGNVRRVLLRLEGQDLDPAAKATDAWAWTRAGRFVERTPSPGLWNEALMELGALVCTPGAPACGACPLRTRCIAHKDETQEIIPRAQAPAKRREVFHCCVLVRDGRGGILVERRPDKGMWGGMTQPPTVERDDRPSSAAELKVRFALKSAALRETFVHHTTHRVVRFTVYEGTARRGAPVRGEFVEARELAGRALSNAHRRILLGA